MAHESLEEYEKALEYDKKSTEIYKGVYGEIHEETAISYNNLTNERLSSNTQKSLEGS